MFFFFNWLTFFLNLCLDIKFKLNSINSCFIVNSVFLRWLMAGYFLVAFQQGICILTAISIEHVSWPRSSVSSVLERHQSISLCRDDALSCRRFVAYSRAFSLLKRTRWKGHLFMYQMYRIAARHCWHAKHTANHFRASFMQWRFTRWISHLSELTMLIRFFMQLRLIRPTVRLFFASFVVKSLVIKQFLPSLSSQY